MHSDGAVFLAAVEIVLCGQIVLLLQHPCASKFCYPVGFSMLHSVIALKTALKSDLELDCTLGLGPDSTDVLH